MAKVKTDVTALEMTSQPFSQEKMNAIFQVSNREPDRLLSRESSWLEFKESFGAKSWEKYARTCAAFANAKGGYLVFGVGNSPRTLKGLLDSRFGDTDPKDFTVYLNSAFAPEIQWEMHLHEYQGKRFGLIYVYEAKTKPIIALKTIGEAEVKEGDIYYRYRARSERIKYAELHEILENRRRRDLDLWLRFL